MSQQPDREVGYLTFLEGQVRDRFGRETANRMLGIFPPLATREKIVLFESIGLPTGQSMTALEISRNTGFLSLDLVEQVLNSAFGKLLSYYNQGIWYRRRVLENYYRYELQRY